MPDTPASRRIRQTLKQIFGFSRLREGQQAVIDRVLAGRSTLAVLPTGAGKSLCYQLPAVLLQGRTIVVSPLIALMKDQCDKLVERGVAAVQINSAQAAADSREAVEAAVDGSARIIFVTPEQLAQAPLLEALKQQPVSLLVVDEAHCISQWGHDFRPAFVDIPEAVQRLGRPTVLALTATATEAVTQEVCDLLAIPRAGVVNTGAFRPNLHYAVELVTDERQKLAKLLSLVHESSGPGIVYAATVKAAIEVHDALAATGESVACYHGKLNASQRRAAQEAFMDGKARVMVATNAFGLGIDKPDTRFVLHYQMPAGLDAYYQESGRAGRDGLAARCTLLFLLRDKAVQQFFLAGRYPGLDELDALYNALCAAPGRPLQALRKALGMPANKLRVAASLLRRLGVLAQDADGGLRALRHGLQKEQLEELGGAYRHKREQDREMLEKMVFYAQTGQCRWRVLLQHLEGESNTPDCQFCDNCLRLARHARAEAARTQAADETPAEAPRPAFQRGDAVTVRRYGRGSVVAADGVSVTIEFAEGSTRCFQPEFVKPLPTPTAGRRKARAQPASTAAPAS
jgi:ATP-dependent DNA helicase RecQ